MLRWQTAGIIFIFTIIIVCHGELWSRDDHDDDDVQHPLKNQLIYEFAINFKEISRLTLPACTSIQLPPDREPQSNQTISSSSSGNSYWHLYGMLHGFFNYKRHQKGSINSAAGISINFLRILSNLTFPTIGNVRQIIIVDIALCGINVTRQILELASNNHMFNSSYHWLLIVDYDEFDGRKDGSDNTELLMGEFLAGFNININTELMVASRSVNPYFRDYYQLFDVWNPGYQFGGKLNISNIGNFSQDNRLQINNWYKRTSTVVRRMDMRNVQVRCMIVVTNNFQGETLVNYLESERNSHLDSMNRFNFALLSHVRDIFNFQMILYRTKSWGYLKNGSFDGMIGALVRHEVDMGGSPIFFRTERAKVIDYTAKTWVARPCFIFRHPKNNNAKRAIFLQPFSNGVWISIIVCGLAIIISGWSTRYAELNILNISEGGAKSSKCHTNRLEHAPSVAADSKGNNNNIQLERNTTTSGCKSSTNVARAPVINSKTKYNFDIANSTDPHTDDFYTTTTTNKPRNIIIDHSGFVMERIHRQYGKSSSRHHKSKLSIQLGYHDHRDTSYHKKWLKKKFVVGRCKLQQCKTNKEINTTPSQTITKLQWNANSTGNFNKNHLKNKISISTGGAGLQILLETINYFIATLCIQGLSSHSILIAGRLMIFVTLVMTFLVYQFYSASIVGMLLSEPRGNINNLRDLIESRSLDLGIEDIIYNRDFFRRTTDPDAIDLYQKIGGANQNSNNNNNSDDEKTTGNDSAQTKSREKHQLPGSTILRSSWRRHAGNQLIRSSWLSPESGLELVKAGGYAFHVDVATAYKIIQETFTEKEICELTEIQLFPPQKMVNIVPKGSPIRKIITYGLRRTEETGLMDRQRKLWHSQKPRCVKQIQPEDLRVDMQTFMSAVLVLIFGFAASVIILILELMQNSRKSHST